MRAADGHTILGLSSPCSGKTSKPTQAEEHVELHRVLTSEGEDDQLAPRVLRQEACGKKKHEFLKWCLHEFSYKDLLANAQVTTVPLVTVVKKHSFLLSNKALQQFV